MRKALPKSAITEARNPRTRGLDRLATREMLSLISREDARVVPAVGRKIPQIARAVDTIVAKLRNGGRLIYVGAGTSGRLAVLDAAECPPTFGVPPRMVQAVIAGGRRALTRAVEGAEDSSAQGERDLRSKKVSSKDVVVGLSASGSAPYVLGALRYAKRQGAATIGIACNRLSPLVKLARIGIVPEVGPEVIAGSTRLKAGTAQKLVLNMLTTATMVRLGMVYDNWMVNVARTNRKLQRRATRNLEMAATVNEAAATRAMRQAGHDARVALVMLKTGVGAIEAKKRLRKAKGNLRRALGE